MKVVFDTNIYISAMIGSRTISALFEKWGGGAFDLYVSEPILTEIQRVLEYPKIKKLRLVFSFEELSAALREQAYLVENLEQLTLLDDEGDNPILATALRAEANYLVTGNLAHFSKAADQVNIASPAQLLAVLG